jgi:hypothetical protein
MHCVGVGVPSRSRARSSSLERRAGGGRRAAGVRSDTVGWAYGYACLSVACIDKSVPAAQVDVCLKWQRTTRVARLWYSRCRSATDGRSLLTGTTRSRQLTEHWCNITKCLYWAAERTDQYHYIEYYDGPNFDTATVTFREYYDLGADPFELRNLLHDDDPTNDPNLTIPAAHLAADRNCAGNTCP